MTDASRAEFEELAKEAGLPLAPHPTSPDVCYAKRDTTMAFLGWRLASSGRSELLEALRELANTARGSVEFDDWPELQASIANAEFLIQKYDKEQA